MSKPMNPTGGAIRMDEDGSGRFGASRGNRKHLGIDLLGMPGQWVVAPETGRPTSIGKPYGDGGPWDIYFRFKGPSGLWRLFYCRPIPGILGRTVVRGQAIGTLEDVSAKYGDSMLPHLHVELIVEKVKIEAPIEGLV